MICNMLEQHPHPGATICANNYIALRCVDGLKDKGTRFPENVGVMSSDDYPFSQIIEPQLTVVDINVRSMGSQAVKHMVDIIRHPNMQIQTYVTTSNVIERESTK